MGIKIAECRKEFFNDIEILSETWGCTCDKDFDGYDLLAEIKTQKLIGVKKGRKSGGVIVLAKKYLRKLVIPKITANFVWLEISKHVIKNANKNFYLITGYIQDILSKYYDPNAFENLVVEISKVCDEDTPLFITGNFNGRTGELDDKYEESYLAPFEISSIPLPPRKSCDSGLNQ